MSITLATLLLGLVTGMGIGALALGLVLVYRASRVINLAHAEIGGAAAAVMALLVRDQHVPYVVAAVVAVATGGLAGVVIEGAVIRPLRHAPRAVVLIATLGVTQLLLAVSIAVIDRIGARQGGYPVPFTATLDLGRGVVLRGPDLALLGGVPALALLLAAFLRWTTVGTAIRAASENQEAARLAGVPVGQLGTLVWAMAGGLAAVTTLILLAGTPLVGAESLGPEVLLEALAACVIARFASLPKALAGGMAVGLIGQVVFYNFPHGGERDLAIFVVILAALLFQSKGRTRVAEGSSWLLAGVIRPVPRALAAARWYRRLGPAIAVGALVAAGLFSLASTNARTLTFTTMVAYAILALSTTVLVGVAGQVSLGQVGFFGVGAAVSYQLSVSVGVPFWLAFAGAGVAGAAASILVGLPALRVPGLLFAVTSLGFALVAQSWLLAKPWLIGAGLNVPRPILGPIDMAGQHAYFVFALCVLGGAMWLTHNLIGNGPGRRMVAVRDNEAGAAAFAVRPARTKLLAFAAAGFLAGVAGALYGHGLQNISVSDFPVANPGLQVGAVDSLRIVAIAVIGGLGSIPGAVFAAALVVGVDQLTGSVALQLAGSSVGLLVLLLVLPGGLSSLSDPIRHRLALVARAARAGQEAGALATAGGSPVALGGPGDVGGPGRVGGRADRSPTRPLIAGTGLTVDFGGIRALAGVDLAVGDGEFVGLVGANGAGKTTLLACLAGYASPDRGSVTFHGDDITRLGPDLRAGRGIVTSFQDARLFPSLPVWDCLMLAQDRCSASGVLSSLLALSGWREAERRRVSAVAALSTTMGLEPYLDRVVGELSTGVRRVLDLGCVIALRPRVLLLDEPSAGLASAEALALAGVLRRVAEVTGAAVVMVEHDLPLVWELAGRIAVLEEGHLVTSGRPEDVRRHPAVAFGEF